ncbi:hypothetical protein ACHQM5_016499 [Ranunculus cassubicifolius]
MGAVPSSPPSNFPIIPRKGTTPAAYLITIRLGNILNLQARNLHFSFKEFSHIVHVYGFNDVWNEREIICKGIKFLEPSRLSASAACFSCLSFFNNKGTVKAVADSGNSHAETPKRKAFNRRLCTNVLLAVNVMVYVAQLATQGKLMLWGAKINSLIDRGQLWRLVTSSFLHANIGHLMVNCYSLNSVGPTMEAISGSRRFLAVYFTSAVTSCAASYWFCKAPAVGASGAIFGVVGSYAVFVLRHRNLFGRGKEDLQQIARVIALNMAIGLLSTGIDNWGHLGGLLGGAAMSWLLGPAWKYEAKSVDGRLIYTDQAPISYLTNRKTRAG